MSFVSRSLHAPHKQVLNFPFKKTRFSITTSQHQTHTNWNHDCFFLSVCLCLPFANHERSALSSATKINLKKSDERDWEKIGELNDSFWFLRDKCQEWDFKAQTKGRRQRKRKGKEEEGKERGISFAGLNNYSFRPCAMHNGDRVWRLEAFR